MNTRPLLTLVGFGPGNGLAIARAFASEGFRLALVSRGKKLPSSLVTEEIFSPRSVSVEMERGYHGGGRQAIDADVM